MGYRFQTTDGSWVGSRITSGITETAALDGTYCAAAATIPGTAKSVHWNSSGTPAVIGNEVFDQVGYATVGAALSAVHGSGSWESSGSGSGARTVTVTVDDNGTLLQNATVRMTDGIFSYSALTNVSGVAVLQLDDATYAIAVSLAGYEADGGNPAAVVVNGDEVVALEMNAVVIPSPTDPTLCRLYGTFLYPSGAVAVGIRVEATLVVNAPATASTGNTIIEKTVFVDTDSDGYAQLDVIKTSEYSPPATYTITVNKCGLKLQGISLTTSTQDINGLL